MPAPKNSLDIIVTCHNTNRTLAEAVNSSLAQPHCQRVIIIDNASNDGAKHLAKAFAAENERITTLQLLEHTDMATVRNWALLHTQADLVAFLDADSAYQGQPLANVPTLFERLPQMSALFLQAKPVDLDARLRKHPNFPKVWQQAQLLMAGNSIFRRSVLLACGGFPVSAYLSETGGEAMAVNLALSKKTLMGRLATGEYGVLQRCRPNQPVERLLRAQLFGDGDLPYTANDVKAITQRLEQAHSVLTSPQTGVRPIRMK